LGEARGKEGDRSTGLNLQLWGAAVFDVAGINVYVAAALLSRRLTREEVKQIAEKIPLGVIAAFLPANRLNLCKAALAYVYVLEDRELGTVRVRDDNVHFLLYMTEERQARDAVTAAEPYEAVVLASRDKELVEEALHSLSLGLSGGLSWEFDGRCSPSDLEGVTLHRLRLLSK